MELNIRRKRNAEIPHGVGFHTFHDARYLALRSQEGEHGGSY
jgi:hypothetical protein